MKSYLLVCLVAMNPVSRLFKKNAVCNIFSRNYAFKSDLKIKWVRPEKIASIRPEKSGDLKSSSIPDKSLLRYEFRHSKELESADEIVRKLFTLEFATKSDKNKVYREELIDDVKSHEFDSSSVEVRIAKWTGMAYLCELSLVHIFKFISHIYIIHDMV